MAETMSDEQRRQFLSAGTRTAILSTVRRDGRPHAAPVWFVLDGDEVVFMTGRDTVKGRSLRRSGQAALTVDSAEPPYDFVTLTGRVEVSEDPEQMLPWSVAIARRYMGEALAEEYGRRNAVDGELLVRLIPEHTVAQARIAD